MSFRDFVNSNRQRRLAGLVPAVLLSAFTVIPCNVTSAAEVDITSLFGPDLTPYSLQYEARYQGYKASAGKTLTVTESGDYQLNTLIELKILFQTVSSIDETSVFTVNEGVITPHVYTFEQNGLGSRERSQVFDHEQGMLTASMDEDTYDIAFSGSILDSLTAMLYLREQVSVGMTDITFQIADKAEVEEHHYQAGATELIETPLGEFNAVRVERIREPDSPRQTTLWLLPEFGYVMAAFEQINEDDEKLEFHLAEGIYGESEIKAAE